MVNIDNSYTLDTIVQHFNILGLTESRFNPLSVSK